MGIPEIIVILMAFMAWPHAQPGTFQIVQDGESIIRTDTRTGAMERCTVAGNALTCEPISVAAK